MNERLFKLGPLVPPEPAAPITPPSGPSSAFCMQPVASTAVINAQPITPRAKIMPAMYTASLSDDNEETPHTLRDCMGRAEQAVRICRNFRVTYRDRVPGCVSDDADQIRDHRRERTPRASRISGGA